MARSRTTWDPQRARELAAISLPKARAAAAWKRANPPAKLAVEPAMLPSSPSGLDFEDLSLSRVRAHLHNLHQVISTEETKKRPDAQRLHWLCKSLAELSELERRLAGRPLPGSRRPAPEPSPGRMARAISPPAARPARPTPAPPSPAADDLDDDPPLQPAPLD